VRELQIFIASPGDLPEEREVVRDVANLISLDMKSLGVRLNVYGWEDEQPGLGRPQEIINRQVDNCDIFIGILNERWGSPTGEYSSGFEEEYERVMRRQCSGEFPKVAIFFKTIENSRLKDPGSELEKVLAFRRKQIEQRVLLYKEFADSADFRSRVTSYFTVALSELASTSITASPEGTVARNPSNIEISDQPVSEGRQQISGALATYTGLLQDQPKIPEPRQLWHDRDRLLLFALAASRDDQVIPVYAANRLYLQRDELTLIEIEVGLWLRSYASDVSRSSSWQSPRSIPIWGVIRTSAEDIDLEAFGKLLVAYAIGDDTSATNGVFLILRQLHIRPDVLSDKQQAPAEKWVKMLEGQNTPDAAFSYMATVAVREDLPLVEALIYR
jgi:hypothetical protein